MHICNVILSNNWGELNPDVINKGVGGREGAMLYLSREWAKLGHEVTNFVNVEKSTRFETGNGYHEYVPVQMTTDILTNFPYDVAIAWECPSLFKNENLKVKLKICEMQVCHLSAEEGYYASNNCDYVAALSNWHKEFLLDSQIEMPEDRVVVFPNGVDIDKYPKQKVSSKMDKKLDNPKFVYSSSPDRALWQLLQSWPYIKQSFPNAELKVGYGFKQWTSQLKWSHSRQGEQALQIEELMEQDDIQDIGKIGQDKLAELQLESDAWLYPLDSIQATESGCITAVENAAAGNPLITTNCDCMEEEFGPIGVISELPFEPKDYADCVEYVLSDDKIMNSLREDGREFAETRDWGKIAPKWIQFFQKNL